MGIGLCAAIYFTRRFFGRSVEVATLFYVATLSPLLGFVMVYTFRYTFVADHYQYVASIGLIALAAAGITIAFKTRPVLKLAGCGALLLTLGILTWRQAGMYTDMETLWQTTIRRNPNCSMGYINLGLAYSHQGRLDEAILQYQKVLQINPDETDALNNLGSTFLQQGRLDEAIAHYQKALAINPDYADAQNNLGCAFLQQGRLDEAVAHYQKALAIKSDDADVHVNLGNAFLQQGRLDEAMAQYQKALAIKPDYAEAHNNLGSVFIQQERVEEAIAHFQKALAIKPDYADAHNNLGSAFLQQGRLDEAVAHYQKALAIKPDDADVQNKLAWLLATSPQASLRNGNQAVELAQRANQLTGGENPVILRTLAAACAEAGRFSEAVAITQRALPLAEAQSNKALADDLRLEMKLYQARIPFHSPEQTSSAHTSP